VVNDETRNRTNEQQHTSARLDEEAGQTLLDRTAIADEI
jgi:hypothetical protein